MTTILAASSRTSGAGSSDTSDSGTALTGPFMLTLCHFEGPVSLRPSRSPQLRRFTFFTTSAPQRNGGELVYLHMGYFETLTDAQSLLPAVRRRFPHAIASLAPVELPQPGSCAPALHATESPTEVAAEQSFAPIADESLTDTQVMRILERRGLTTTQDRDEQPSSAEIGVIRPEDTTTRRALKQAVAEGAPVFFAVQLDWADRPINPGRIPSVPLFKTHTLYETESRREDRCRYFLRLGFFADAATAKEAAFSVRSKFASAVVVPVTEQEIARAHEAATDGLGFARVHLPLEHSLERSGAGSPAPIRKSPSNGSRKSPRKSETLEQTLETLAARETWNDSESLNDTGVRHLKVEVLERESPQ